MAFNCSKHLFIKICKYCNGQKSFLPLLKFNPQFYNSVVYSTNYNPTKEKISKAMASYLKRAKENDEFLKEQLAEFNFGKQHLANIMGVDVEKMTQEKIDEAIEYLFPSGLFVAKARPIMKPPDKIFLKRKAAEFDFTGRPHHFLFYTANPNFSKLLHDAAIHLEELNKCEDEERKLNIKPPKSLVLTGIEWIKKENLENKVLEKLYTVEYENFIEVLNALAVHPYASKIEQFIMSYAKRTSLDKKFGTIKPVVGDNGTLLIKVSRAKRKTSVCQVDLSYPGKGKIVINNEGIDYFKFVQSREQFHDMDGLSNISPPK